MRKNLIDVKPVSSIKDMLRNAVAEVGDRIAYRFARGEELAEVSYAQFRADTLALGQALHERGLSCDHIAIAAPNSYDWITVYLTVLQSAGVFVPIDKDLPEQDFLHVLTDSDARVLFCTKQHAAILEKFPDAAQALRAVILLDEPAGDGKLSFAELLREGYRLRAEGESSFEEEQSDPLALKMLVYTSGTTGLAKGVMLSEHNLCSSIFYGLQRCTPGRVGLSVLPYHHVYEAVPGILVAIHHHCTLCLNENLRSVSKNMLRYKPDYIYLVPAFVEAFYKKIWASIDKKGKRRAFSALIKLSDGLRKIGIDRRRAFFAPVLEAFGGELRQIVCGGAPIRAELGAFFDSIGIALYNGYGITECSPLVSVNTPSLNDCTTVGLPLPCCEIRLADVNEDGDGEICVRGDIVMLGYYKRPDLTRDVIDPDGWFHTGDYGRITPRGQLMITGRKKNLIVLTNGKNIFPEEQEGYIQQIPYVAEVVVFGIRNRHGLEEALGAEVFLNQEALAELQIEHPEEALRSDIAHALAHLPTYKHIARIFIRDIPFEKTTSNKIRRSSLLYAEAAHEEWIQREKNAAP